MGGGGGELEMEFGTEPPLASVNWEGSGDSLDLTNGATVWVGGGGDDGRVGPESSAPCLSVSEGVFNGTPGAQSGPCNGKNEMAPPMYSQ